MTDHPTAGPGPGGQRRADGRLRGRIDTVPGAGRRPRPGRRDPAAAGQAAMSVGMAAMLIVML